MRRCSILLIFFLIVQAALKAQSFEVAVDTLYLNIKEIARSATRISMTHAVKYDGKYYCFFYERGLYSYNKEKRYFLIISDKGIILNNIEVPEEIENTVYFDFFIRDERLFAKTYMDHESFYFDLEKLKWKKVNEVDDRVYEDSNYVISYLDFGEWGQSTWFIDKQAKNEYVLGVCGTTVNKLNGKYYLTSGYEVREIEDPRKLKQCDKDYKYKRVEKERKFYEGSPSLSGSKTIFEDTTYSPWGFEQCNLCIITSFVTDNQLFQLYEDSSSSYIGKIKNHRLVPILDIGRKYQTFNWHYSYRGENLENNNRFIKFQQDNNTFGFLEIKDTQIDVKYLIHNQDSLRYLGSDGFKELFNRIQLSSDKLSIENIDSLEYCINGKDLQDYITVTAHNGFHSDVYATMKVEAKRYIKVEDKYVSLLTEYLYTTQDNLVKSIFFEWTPTEHYSQTGSFVTFPDENSEIRERFQHKFKEIADLISQQTNQQPQKEDRGNDRIWLTWSLKNGIKIKLYGSTSFDGGKRIRMVIDLGE